MGFEKNSKEKTRPHFRAASSLINVRFYFASYGHEFVQNKIN